MNLTHWCASLIASLATDHKCVYDLREWLRTRRQVYISVLRLR